MSRIQNILEKAQRDGAVRRMRPLAEPAAIAVEAPASVPLSLMPPAAPAPAILVGLEEPPAAAVVAPATRIVRSQLDRTLAAALSPGAFAAEQYRALRTRVAHGDHGAAVDVLLITSPGRGEGKSLTAANLALMMGQDFQSRICLVD